MAEIRTNAVGVTVNGYPSIYHQGFFGGSFGVNVGFEVPLAIKHNQKDWSVKK